MKQCYYHGKEQSKNYFEGWYFKHTSDAFSFSCIPGIAIDKVGNKHVFIQIITQDCAYVIDFPDHAFHVEEAPFKVVIGRNSFSLNHCTLDIKTDTLSLKASLQYTNITPLKPTWYAPTIMGPFGYASFLECYHGLLSLNHDVVGDVSFQDKNYRFNGKGYSEQDYGHSFPKSWIWLQGNHFALPNTSLFFSVADVPFKQYKMNGFLCILLVAGKVYRFATYNGSKIICIDPKKGIIVLKKGHYKLIIKYQRGASFELIAPKEGTMVQAIEEAINASINVQLFRGSRLIMTGTSQHVGLETVGTLDSYKGGRVYHDD